jgi:hypothetical protein
MQFLNSFWGYLHLPPPPPPPPHEPLEFIQQQVEEAQIQEPLPVEVEQVLEDPVEVQVEDEEEEIHVVESDGDDDEIVFVGEIAAPERRGRRRARRVRDDDEEYVVERVLDRRYFHGVENFLIEWSGYGPEENSWELGHEKRVEIPDAISLYFQINGIADDGIMILRSRDEEFVEDRQPRERPFLDRAAKRPRFI